MSLLHALDVTYDFTLIPKSIKQSFWNVVTQNWLYFILVISIFLLILVALWHPKFQLGPILE